MKLKGLNKFVSESYFPHELENVEESRKKGLPRWCYLPKKKTGGRDTWGSIPGQEILLEEGMASHFDISYWEESPWKEGTGGL